MSHGRKISVVGLGYVGLPVAVSFGNHGRVVGFDIDGARIDELIAGVDRTGAFDPTTLAEADIGFTADPRHLARADFHIVTVPTPVNAARGPDLDQVRSACRIVGEQLGEGDIVVFESTVYPGVTEDECVPLLEHCSGLTAGVEFTVGYSPERINPGDLARGFADIVKVVSGQDKRTLDIISAVYGSVVTAGVHRASSIRIAEAAKVVENTQRDLNIAFMNEIAMLFDRMDIDTGEVLAVAGTKWNFLPFTPGLVGGHCIGVDPYYLSHKAATMGSYAELILTARRINDAMGAYVAQQAVKHLARLDGGSQNRVVTILGLTFKENVADLRNTRVIDIVRELRDYGFDLQICDPIADPCEARRLFELDLVPVSSLRPADCVIVAVSHQLFRDAGWAGVKKLLRAERGAVIDVKSILPPDDCPPDVDLWRL